jgi:nucleoside triphosphate pyrophosphatase
MENVDLVLASASPRRKELLRQIGVRFKSRAMAVDESLLPNESAVAYVRRLAETKAQAARDAAKGLPVLGADTIVVLGDRVMGKPLDEDDAMDMLQSLSGKQHLVITAVAVVAANRCELRMSSTRVTFAEIGPAQCRQYWRTGEPVDKAGAYAIQGLGAVFVASIEGSYSGVVGLPLAETRELLELFKIPYWHNEFL